MERFIFIIVQLIKMPIDASNKFKCEVLVLENIRFFKEEDE